MEWKKLINNEVLDMGEFYISFNPHKEHITGLSFFRPDTDRGETALVKEKDIENKIQFRILNGDFRKEYEELVSEGFTACLNFYNSKKEKYNSSWTL